MFVKSFLTKEVRLQGDARKRKTANVSQKGGKKNQGEGELGQTGLLKAESGVEGAVELQGGERWRIFQQKPGRRNQKEKQVSELSERSLTHT